MIVVRTTLNVLPEKQLEVMQTLGSLIEDVAKETGCRRYSVSCDIKDNNCISLLEEWETRKNLDRHIMSQRFGVLLGIKTLLCEPIEIQIHTVSKSEGMEAIVALRNKNAKRKPGRS